MLVRALITLFVLLIILYFVQIKLTGSYLWILFSVFSAGIQTLFAITVHRVVLLGPEAVPQWGLWKWTRRETVFILHFFGLMLMMLPLTLFTRAGPVSEPSAISGMLVAYVGLCWLWGRLSLVFPAIATDADVSFKYSWEQTKGYQGVMFGVVMIFPITISAFTMFLNFLPLTLDNPETYLEYITFINFAAHIVTTLTTVFVIAALSIAYQEICGEF